MFYPSDSYSDYTDVFFNNYNFDNTRTNKKSRTYTKGPHNAKMAAKRKRQNRVAKQARKVHRKKK